MAIDTELLELAKEVGEMCAGRGKLDRLLKLIKV